jgi:Cu+-exporting ATPase
MAKDPVCGIALDGRSPHKCTHQGQTYLFCCQTCRMKFESEPGRYASPSDGFNQRLRPPASLPASHPPITVRIGQFMHSISPKFMSKGTISGRRAFK